MPRKRTPAVTIICTDLKLTEEQRNDLRDRFKQALVDVLAFKVPEPFPEVFPIDFTPAQSAKGKKKPKV